MKANMRMRRPRVAGWVLAAMLSGLVIVAAAYWRAAGGTGQRRAAHDHRNGSRGRVAHGTERHMG